MARGLDDLFKTALHGDGSDGADRSPPAAGEADRRMTEPRAFLDQAEAWLLKREAENNLPLAIVGSLLRRDATIPSLFRDHRAGEDVGAAPSARLLQAGPDRCVDAIPSLASDVAEV